MLESHIHNSCARGPLSAFRLAHSVKPYEPAFRD
jgi:hypothetical protein